MSLISVTVRSIPALAWVAIVVLAFLYIVPEARQAIGRAFLPQEKEATKQPSKSPSNQKPASDFWSDWGDKKKPKKPPSTAGEWTDWAK